MAAQDYAAAVKECKGLPSKRSLLGRIFGGGSTLDKCIKNARRTANSDNHVLNVNARQTARAVAFANGIDPSRAWANSASDMVGKASQAVIAGFSGGASAAGGAGGLGSLFGAGASSSASSNGGGGNFFSNPLVLLGGLLAAWFLFFRK